jgi:predicted small secreted protein
MIKRGFFMRHILMTSLASCVVLAACATVVDGVHQDITFDVTGADQSLCNVGNKEFAYTVRPPQTISVQRGYDDLKVVCQATGNREVAFDLPSKTNGMIAGNIVTAIIPGITYDILAGAAYEYPSRVMVDFSEAKTRPFTTPLVEDRGIEDTGAKMLALPGDSAATERRRAAQAEYERQKEFDAERTERMLEFDPGMKK